MSDINQGGLAFPAYDHHGDGRPFLAATGMTLRAYAAVQILAGTMLNPPPGHYSVDDPFAWRAAYAVRQADALIAALNGQTEAAA